MKNQLVKIDRNELSKLVEMLREVQDRLESIELASDPELMESLRKSKEEIANGDVVNFDDL